MKKRKERPYSERHENERLSDNSFPQYQVCKDCKKRDDGTVWSNKYNKCCCQQYPYPSFKPETIQLGMGTCPFYEKEK